MDDLPQLRAFAMRQHAGQLYGSQPYVVHLDEVFEIVVRHGLGAPYERAAFGHDLLDDTQTTPADLVKRFGRQESDLIYSVSGAGHNRVARREDTLERLRRYPLGVNLKMADRYANLARSLLDEDRQRVKMYLGERSAFEPLFMQGCPSLFADLQQLYARAEQFLAFTKGTQR